MEIGIRLRREWRAMQPHYYLYSGCVGGARRSSLVRRFHHASVALRMGAGTQREDLHTEGTSTKVSGGTTLRLPTSDNPPISTTYTHHGQLVLLPLPPSTAAEIIIIFSQLLCCYTRLRCNHLDSALLCRIGTFFAAGTHSPSWSSSCHFLIAVFVWT